MRKYNILMVSTFPPDRSAGLAQDMINALESEGHVVDFFTMYGFHGQKENQYSIYPEPTSAKILRYRKLIPLPSFLRKMGASVYSKLFSSSSSQSVSVENHGYRIPQFDESKPVVDNDILFDSLPEKQYDFVMTYVTERMLTTISFLTIYQKYKAPLLIICMDMLHLTGGCYFFGDCRRFMKGCGKCLVLDSDDENDQTHKNYLIKASVYPQIEYGIICNLYQKEFASQTQIFAQNHIFTVSMLIDEDVFVPQNRNECRKLFGIGSQKTHIILSRYQTGVLARSKGYDHMVSILNILFDKLSEDDKNKCLLVLIGSKESDIAQHIKMDTLFLGTVDIATLTKCYSVATVFISTSIDDAGPSMVNQSMMCGTPVVTFSIGTALEVTREGINGYMASNYNDEEFADGILKIITKSDDDYEQMSKRTRMSALEMNSKKVCARQIIDIYEKVKSMYNR